MLTKGSYKNPNTCRDWALDAYKETWKCEAPEHKCEVPPKALLTIITWHVSWIRGKIKEPSVRLSSMDMDFEIPRLIVAMSSTTGD
ncbi:hypothetical protein FRC06_003769 [Ceratobasidium sp. 370]|nr:hypothetical protein FRC06_003769 [Ceratobasidium sp. 370]